MQLSSRFTMAIHILLFIKQYENEYKITSSFLASSINTNPVVVRKIMIQLKESKIIETSRTNGTVSLTKELSKITFFDIYKAVNCVNGNLFSFHENPNKNCFVGRNIFNLLDCKLSSIQTVFENELKKYNLQKLLDELNTKEK